MGELINLHDFEAAARSLMEPAIWDYYAGGSDDEVTVRGNREAWERWWLRPRVLVDVSKVDTSTTVLGTPVRMPILVAPTAGHGLCHPDGECATARAAAEAGTILIASTSSSSCLEDIAQSCEGAKWFQLYLREWSTAEAILSRAVDAGFRAIVLTVDFPCFGRRERDVRNAFGVRNFPLGNFDGGEPEENLCWDRLTWDVVDWIRARTSLPLVLKGILTAEDAQIAVEQGVDGIVVSNHGGRQLDGAIPSIEVLPEVVEAVGGRCDVYVDGGVRRGTDVLKALALGAKAVLVGRPVLWGLAVDGADGAARVLRLLGEELERAMKLAGKPTLAAIDSSLVLRSNLALD
jgi:isopentenyl diphosphate isomerase/L-lactate dehydrogenase-like FMN-dependent dehydrogenase